MSAMYEIHGSVQTSCIRGGRVHWYSSRPVWFVISEWLPDNSKVSTDGGETWSRRAAAVHIVDEEHAVSIAKAILGENGDHVSGVVVEVEITARKISAEWPFNDPPAGPMAPATTTKSLGGSGGGGLLRRLLRVWSA